MDGKGGWLGAFRRWKRGPAQIRRKYRETLLETNAFYWLSARDRLKPHYVLWFLTGCGAFWVLLWIYNPREMLEQEAFFITAVLLHLSLKVWVSMEAGRQLYDDRRNSGRRRDRRVGRF